jgi:DNA polymerase III alpha subunit
MKAGRKSLEQLKQCKFDNRDEDRKEFEVVQRAFKEMAMLNNENISDYVLLMKDVIEFL